MTKGVDFGIDFGTTNCAIGRLRPDGRESTLGPFPSVGSYTNGVIHFGKEAQAELRKGDPRVFAIRDLKLLLGTDDARAGTVRLNAVSLAEQLIRYLVSQIVAAGTELGAAIIGTPVQMSRTHRAALREAALQAGFMDVHFIYEPTAALVGELSDDVAVERSLVAVIDWGGGTLDLSVVRVEGDVYREISVGGDVSQLGGTQIDEALTHELLRRNPPARDRMSALPGMHDRLKEDVRDVKESLLSGLEADLDTHEYVAPVWLDEQMPLSLELLSSVLREFAVRATNQIRDTLNRAHLRAEDVTHLLFAGGVCKSAIVREELQKLFPDARLLGTGNPQLQTGCGCTRLTKRPFSVELAADVAVRQTDNSLAILLPRGQRVELEAYRRAHFLLTDSDAPEAIFDVGTCHSDSRRVAMLAADADGFQSLRQLWVRTAGPQTTAGKGVGDEVLMHIGVDRNLSVAINLRSCNGNSETEEFLSGVPLAIRLGPSA